MSAASNRSRSHTSSTVTFSTATFSRGCFGNTRQEVVCPKRLAHNRRPSSSETNAFGVGPYLSQYASSASPMRPASNGKGGSQSAMVDSSVIPATLGTQSRSAAAPRMAVTAASQNACRRCTYAPPSERGSKNSSTTLSPTLASRRLAVHSFKTISPAAKAAIGLPATSTKPLPGSLLPVPLLPKSTAATVLYGTFRPWQEIVLARYASTGRTSRLPSELTIARWAVGEMIMRSDVILQ